MRAAQLNRQCYGPWPTDVRDRELRAGRTETSIRARVFGYSGTGLLIALRPCRRLWALCGRFFDTIITYSRIHFISF
jgi:hypothetical protein